MGKEVGVDLRNVKDMKFEGICEEVKVGRLDDFVKELS